MQTLVFSTGHIIYKKVNVYVTFQLKENMLLEAMSDCGADHMQKVIYN